MSAKELRDLSAEELQAKAAELRAEVTQLNLKRYAHRLDKSSDLVTTKRELARVLTVLTEKSRATAGGAS